MAHAINDYQQFIAASRYSRWNGKRRELWPETVDRYMTHVVGKHIENSDPLFVEIRNHILNFEVMPSMRALMTAGEALERDHISIFNCSYLPVDDYRAFDEAMYILMCGTGLGFSVENYNISKLPVVAEEFDETDTIIKVADSKIGWATSFRELISLLYSGKIPKYDTSKIRPKGSPLKIFGGRASGPLPLMDLFEYCINIFKNAAGRKLNSLEIHGIMCKIGDIVVVGGVRRARLISLSDLSDNTMRYAKTGEWWVRHPEFRLANNSAVYLDKPDLCTFLDEWKSLYASKSGERGIINRKAAKEKVAKYSRRDDNYDFGVNPCSEILLRPYGLCNLSEVVIKDYDTPKTLKKKVEIATILGTIQSTFTNFRYLRKIWKKNADEERLLGVSLTGIFDNPLTYTLSKDTEQLLASLREEAVAVNKKWAAKLNVSPSTAITCVKPSGTVSQLCDSSSGIHPRFGDYYIRSVRQNNSDPITHFMKDNNVKNESCLFDKDNTTIFYFPMHSPEKSIKRTELDALTHLKTWMMYNSFWAEHTVSVTINVKENEWMSVAAFVYENFDSITGISFLPYDGGTYKQAPYTECTVEVYDEHVKNSPKLDWNELAKYETFDSTTGTQELACVVGGCEI